MPKDRWERFAFHGLSLKLTAKKLVHPKTPFKLKKAQGQNKSRKGSAVDCQRAHRAIVRAVNILDWQTYGLPANHMKRNPWRRRYTSRPPN